MAPLAYTNLIPELKGLPLDHIGSFINVAVIAYAITRYNLLDIRLIARRGLGWLVMAVLFSGIYAGLTYLGLNYLPDVTPGVIYTFASIIIVFLSITGRPIRKAIEAGIDRLIYQRAYDHREALVDFTRNMVGNLNLEELANELLPMLANALGISCSYLLLKDGDTGEFRSHFIFPRPEQDEISALMVFDQDSPIIHWLDKHKEHLNTAKIDQLPQFKALWKDERDQLEKKGIQLLFPIKSADKLVAVLALSSKGKKCLYSAEDISILEGIASQVGVMLQNAQLYTFAIIKANTDELTGLYNHRHFHERLEQEIARNSRFGGTFSLIILDIDLFKVYNDIYGHLAGDQVLRKMGKYIQASIRNIDLAFRYGGEEFTIILPEANAQDAFKVAERIRKTIEANTSLRAMPITASIGIANWPNDGIMREEIISAADTALYQSKNNGRNRTSYACDVLTSSVDSLLADMTSYSRSISIIYALAATVDAKDSYTYGHSRKVSDYAVSLAEQIHLPDNQINIIRAAGLLHDIGKIGIADSILNKNGSLDKIEWKAIKTHPEIGVEILRHIHELADCMPLILHHHERYDGKGYPAGLMGENIPQGARILSIADAYDAMTTARPYRGRMSCEDALLTLKKNSGTQFDSYLVEIFCEYIRLNQPESSPA
jgi:diguanylate cyclase (GGDEF)-like protein/putative nucleotidyltransferase with HDIG domain